MQNAQVTLGFAGSSYTYNGEVKDRFVVYNGSKATHVLCVTYRNNQDEERFCYINEEKGNEMMYNSRQKLINIKGILLLG